MSNYSNNYRVCPVCGGSPAESRRVCDCCKGKGIIEVRVATEPSSCRACDLGAHDQPGGDDDAGAFDWVEACLTEYERTGAPTEAADAVVALAPRTGATFKEMIENGSVRLFHSTHRNNVVSIQQHGILSLNQLKGRAIDRRTGFLSSPESRDLDSRCFLDGENSLADYVRLSFVPLHPVVLAAIRDKRIAKDDISVLEVDLAVVRLPGVLVANGIAYAHETQQYDAAGLLTAEPAGVFDWDAVIACCKGSRDFSPTAKAARKYEVLVPNFVDAKHILRVTRA